jgi:hypothetical protein
MNAPRLHPAIRDAARLAAAAPLARLVRPQSPLLQGFVAVDAAAHSEALQAFAAECADRADQLARDLIALAADLQDGGLPLTLHELRAAASFAAAYGVALRNVVTT